MRLLLDTYLLVWAMGSAERLSPELKTLLEKPAHTLVFSVASVWELVIKRALGRADVKGEPAVLRRALLDGGWQELAIEAHHALAVAHLPPLHRDPFDRLLLAQASTNGLLLITADPQLAAYPGPVRLT